MVAVDVSERLEGAGACGHDPAPAPHRARRPRGMGHLTQQTHRFAQESQRAGWQVVPCYCDTTGDAAAWRGANPKSESQQVSPFFLTSQATIAVDRSSLKRQANFPGAMKHANPCAPKSAYLDHVAADEEERDGPGSGDPRQAPNVHDPAP
jgi:hypothetical protein